MLTVDWELMTESPPMINTNQQGTEATCQFKIYWADAFTFHREVMGTYRTLENGIVVIGNPLRYPGNPRLAAIECSITPLGWDERPRPRGSYKGLLPGEYWQYAKATVKFGVPDFISIDDDPQGYMQFDPANPITWCTQDLDSSVEYRSSNMKYRWESDDKPVPFQIPNKSTVVELTLKFPRVAQIPFAKLIEFIDCVNSHPVFGCEPGTVVFLGPATSQSSTSLGIRDKTVVLKFKYSSLKWNEFERKDGLIDKPLRPTSADGVYFEEDLRRIFL